ncbi:protein of unknown function [Clostridium cochlearium]|uniref:DUF4160 domain-containing protein n=1 Tax=Clostridium cochlearium TaxID=1494 RepID=A0ABY0QLE4_CLOCO|nr:DUF4160 domain-containing protein [Clostridium cochlearium]SDL15227.1 protein of unknown function [Clostridium cochlearium]
MGELARFEDIRIKMYPMDTQKHKEPHFHVILTNGNKASVSVATGKILASSVPYQVLSQGPPGVMNKL